MSLDSPDIRSPSPLPSLDGSLLLDIGPPSPLGRDDDHNANGVGSSSSTDPYEDVLTELNIQKRSSTRFLRAILKLTLRSDVGTITSLCHALHSFVTVVHPSPPVRN